MRPPKQQQKYYVYIGRICEELFIIIHNEGRFFINKWNIWF